jgi:RNA recognition motif-containing protein
MATGTSQTPTRSLWIGNLDRKWTLDDLTTLFSPFGPIETIRLLSDRECAFVNYNRLEDAIKAKGTVSDQLTGYFGSSVRIGYGKPETQSLLTMEFGNVQGPTRALCK